LLFPKSILRISIFCLLLFSVPISRISAIIALAKFGLCDFLAPNFISRPFGIFYEKMVPFTEISINRNYAFFNRIIIAVVNNSFSHTTKNRFNYIQKLSLWMIFPKHSQRDSAAKTKSA